MNKLNLFQIGCWFLLITTLSSCTDEPMELDLDAQFVGEWLLNDPESNCEHTLVFDANKTGVEIVGCTYSDDSFVSSAKSFSWSTNSNTITFDFYSDEKKTSFSFDEEGHLYLPDMTDSPEFYFIKIK